MTICGTGGYLAYSPLELSRCWMNLPVPLDLTMDSDVADSSDTHSYTSSDVYEDDCGDDYNVTYLGEPSTCKHCGKRCRPSVCEVGECHVHLHTDAEQDGGSAECLAVTKTLQISDAGQSSDVMMDQGPRTGVIYLSSLKQRGKRASTS